MANKLKWKNLDELMNLDEKEKGETLATLKNKADLSVDEFCFCTGLSRATFYRICAEGTGPGHKKVGNRTVIPAEQIAEWNARDIRKSFTNPGSRR